MQQFMGLSAGKAGDWLGGGDLGGWGGVESAGRGPDVDCGGGEGSGQQEGGADIAVAGPKGREGAA